MRVRVLLPFILFLTFVIVAAPCRGAVRTTSDGSDFPGQTISADLGPTPFMPARTGGESTSPTATSWAAPDASVELLPLPVETAPFLTARDAPRFGYPHGVDRPPKSSS